MSSRADSRARRERHVPASRLRVSKVGLTLGLAALLAAAMAWLTAPAVRAGVLASGADAGSYLLTTRFIVDTLRTTGELRAINPVWYNGFSAFHNTPLLVYIPLTAIYAALGDIVATSHWAHYLFGILPAIAAFAGLRRRFEAGPSALAAFLFAATNIVLGQTTLGGSYTRSLATSLGVLCFGWIDEMATEGVSARRALPTAAVLAAAVVAHPLTGVAFVSCWALYFLVRAASIKQLTAGRILRAIVLPAAVLGLAAWYLVPFFAERQGWTTLPDEIFTTASIGPLASYGWLGLPVLLVAVLGVLLRWRDPLVRSLLWTGLVSWVLAGGVYTYIYILVPALKASYPFVFLFFTAFALAALGAAGLEAAVRSGRGWQLAAALVLAVALVGTTFGAREFSRRAADTAAGYTNPDDTATAAFVRDEPGDGRVMMMRYPFSYLLWWLLGDTGKPNVEGWYYSLTPTGRHIAWAYDAADHGFPEYTAELFGRWNIRQFVTNGNWGSDEDDALLAELESRGFSESLVQGANRVYTSGERSSYVQPLEASTLCIGRYSATAAMMIPGAVVGGSAKVDDYPLELLDDFDTLVLAGFGTNDRAKAEKLVSDFAAGGGTVVIDLYGMDVSAIEEAPSFLNVKGYARIATETIGIRPYGSTIGTATVPARLDVPSETRVSTDEAIRDWRYVAYLGIDRSLADEVGGDGMSLLGVEELEGGGEAVFVGGNLFYHAYRTGRPSEVALVRSLADPANWGKTRRADAITEATGLELAEQSTGSAERIAFSYSAATPAHALVSWAYSPHWKAYVDGERVTSHNIEDLMVLDLPAGEHAVEVRYETLELHPISIAISALTLLGLALAYARERLRARTPQRRPA